jgi:hypothetical protein
MSPDASYAALPPPEAAFVRPDVLAPAPGPFRLTWRHAATCVLLLLGLPVFAAAAVACLPVLLVAAGGQGMNQVWPLARIGAQTPARRLAR